MANRHFSHGKADHPWQQEISIRMPTAHRHDNGIVIGAQALVDWDARDVRLFAQARRRQP